MAPKPLIPGSICTENEFEFVVTPEAKVASFDRSVDCGVTTTSYPTIHNPSLPADGSGSTSFSNIQLVSALFLVPMLLAQALGGGFKTTLLLVLVTFIPILIIFWTIASITAPRKNEKASLPGRRIEEYLSFKYPKDRRKYTGIKKIPMWTFLEMYINGHVKFKGDCLEVLEYRHDWATFNFTFALFKFFFLRMIPEVILHTRSQDEEAVREQYDIGDDFYLWFLGPRMIYTSGIISDVEREETLEELQDNKMAIVCEKIGLKANDKLLDIGCGWGTFVRFASTNYKARADGITLGRNQTKWGNDLLQKAGISEEQSKIICMDYRDIPTPKTTARYNKITCLEMAEHVGIRHLATFFGQVYEMLDDDGVFFLQISGLRKCWQYEDLVWGLFMNKYIFPGADASTPLAPVVDRLEGAGFEIKSIDTIGVHYSATLWRWYRNWLGNRTKVESKYGEKVFRIWEYFLASSTIASRQGSATTFQICMVKNINSTHRINLCTTEFGLRGALTQSKVKGI